MSVVDQACLHTRSDGWQLVAVRCDLSATLVETGRETAGDQFDRFGWRARRRLVLSSPGFPAPDRISERERVGQPELFDTRMVRPPMSSLIAKRVCRQTSQECCPWNVRFSAELKEPAFAPREILAGNDARTLARDP